MVAKGWAGQVVIGHGSITHIGEHGATPYIVPDTPPKPKSEMEVRS